MDEYLAKLRKCLKFMLPIYNMIEVKPRQTGVMPGGYRATARTKIIEIYKKALLSTFQKLFCGQHRNLG